MHGAVCVECIGKRASVDKLHDEIGAGDGAIRLADVVDGDDVRVIEPRGGACFAHEAFGHGGLGGGAASCNRKTLMATCRDERFVVSQIDSSHSAFAEAADKTVGAEPVFIAECGDHCQ